MAENIVSLEPSDSRLIIDLFGNLFGKDLPFPPEAVDYFNRSFSKESLIQSSNRSGSLLLGIKYENELAAFVQGSPPEGGVGTIIWLVVSPKLQGCGLGEKLFTAACSHYRSINTHKLKLTAPSSRAVAFYKRIGMREEGFHPAHWWHMDFWSLGFNLK
jgi:ribosomal protein S18 acetylase RimI-like enzyme